jgi:ribosomal silencing factor RsfS
MDNLIKKELEKLTPLVKDELEEKLSVEVTQISVSESKTIKAYYVVLKFKSNKVDGSIWRVQFLMIDTIDFKQKEVCGYVEATELNCYCDTL